MRASLRAYAGLSRGRSFRSLLVSKLLTRIATDALLYALLIRVVQESGSPRYTTLLVLMYTMPAVAFGLMAGAAAEASALRPLLVAGHISRALLVSAMIAFGSDVWLLYALLFAFATVGQLVGPAEASSLPRLVRPDDRPAAHSLVAFLVMVGTLVGAVVAGPVLFKLVGWRAVLALSVALHGVAAVFATQVRVEGPVRGESTPAASAAGLLLHGWRALRASPDAFLAFGYLTIAGALGKVLVALSPYYARDILGIAPENAVYIAGPAGVGALVALATTPVLGKALGLRRTVGIGFFVLLLGFLSVGGLLFVGDLVLTNIDLRVGYIEERIGPSSIIIITMAMAVVIGFGGTMLGIVGATTLNQEVAPASQARVSSTGSTVAAGVSLVPLLATAAVSDLVGVRAVLLGVAVAALAAAMLLRSTHQKMTMERFASVRAVSNSPGQR